MINVFRNALCFLVTCFLLSIFVSDVSACPTCKESVVGTQDNLTTGYYWSILFMMAMPFALFAAWTFIILHLRKKIKLQKLATASVNGIH